MQRKESFLNGYSFRPFILVSIVLGAFFVGYSVDEIVKGFQKLISIEKQKNLECKTCFSPAHDCLSVVIEAINKAEKVIQVQTYSFTSADVAMALIEAHKRKVKVTVLTDINPRTYPHTQLQNLTKEGVEVYFDTGLPVSHSKILIVDDRTVITGSYHFTNEEEQTNSENFVMITDKEIARQYSKEFELRLTMSKVSKVFLS